MFDGKAWKAITTFRIKTHFSIRNNRYQRCVRPVVLARRLPASLPTHVERFVRFNMKQKDFPDPSCVVSTFRSVFLLNSSDYLAFAESRCYGTHAMTKDSRQPHDDLILARLERVEAKVDEICTQLEVIRILFSSKSDDGSDDDSSNAGDLQRELQATLARLSPRERQVLTLFAELQNCKKVAGAIGTETQTVRNQLASIRAKLDVHSREEFWDAVIQLRPWLKNG